jgi:hypothetical protein
MHFSIYLNIVLPMATRWITCIRTTCVWSHLFLNSLIIDLLTNLINGWISISKYLYIKRMYLFICMPDMYHILLYYIYIGWRPFKHIYISIYWYFTYTALGWLCKRIIQLKVSYVVLMAKTSPPYHSQSYIYYLIFLTWLK